MAGPFRRFRGTIVDMRAPDLCFLPLSLFLPLGVPGAQGGDLALLGSATEGTGGFPVLGVRGGPFEGHPFALRIERARGGALGVLAVGLEDDPRPLDIGGNAVLHPSAPLEFYPFAVSDEGTVEVFALGSVPPSLVGVSIVAQAAIRDPLAAGGWAFTRGLRVDLGVRPTGPVFGAGLYDLGDPAADVVAGDFDGDGIADAVVATGTVQFLPGNPETGYGARTLLPGFGLPQADLLASGDLDLDGNLDFVRAGRSLGGVRSGLGRGDGTFQAVMAVTFAELDRMVLGDLNGDNLPDLIAISESRGTLETALGMGDGTFVPVASLANLGGSLAVGDVDEDGRLDVMAWGGGPSVRIYRGGGDGTLTFLADTTFASRVLDFVAGDMDGDGHVDIAAYLSRDWLFVRRGSGDGTFANTLFHNASGLGRMVLEDADLDGDLDILAVDHQGDSFSLFFGNGDGTLAPQLVIPTFRWPTALALGDASGDGRPDLFVSGLWAEALAVYRFDEHGRPLGGRPSETSKDFLRGIVEDFDRDQNLDFAALDQLSGLEVLWGDGTGDFPSSTVLGCSSHSRGAGAADLDGDGWLDFVVSCTASSSLRIYLGAGRTFVPAPDVPIATIGPANVALGDLNGDGDVDLVVGGGFNDEHYVTLLGNGDGTFGSMQTFFLTRGRALARPRAPERGRPPRPGRLDRNSTLGEPRQWRRVVHDSLGGSSTVRASSSSRSRWRSSTWTETGCWISLPATHSCVCTAESATGPS